MRFHHPPGGILHEATRFLVFWSLFGYAVERGHE
jgi:hypothetical protein